MSPLQYGMLRYIRQQQPAMDAARHFNQCTLSSLLYRGWITTRSGHWVETKEGSAALDRYVHAKLPERQYEGDLAPSVQRNMKVYRVITMRKRDAA
jgi:hypothetical protein